MNSQISQAAQAPDVQTEDVGHGGSAADDGHVAFVEIMERRHIFLALQPGANSFCRRRCRPEWLLAQHREGACHLLVVPRRDRRLQKFPDSWEWSGPGGTLMRPAAIGSALLRSASFLPNVVVMTPPDQMTVFAASFSVAIAAFVGDAGVVDASGHAALHYLVRPGG